MPRFPLTLGATVSGIIIPPPPPPFWTPLGKNSLGWQAVSAGQMPRFEHVFPQESGGDQQFKRDTTPPIGTP